MPYSLVAEGVSFVLPDGTPLLESIDLSLPRGFTALVGPNGSGKSTLLALLAGALRPARGRVLRSGSVALLPQSTAPDRGGVARDLLEARDAPEWLAARVLAEVGLDGLDLDRPAATLSGGETTRLRLARLLLGEPETLLLDEPTNHLDGEARQAVHDLVRSFRGAVLVATHDRALLARADRIAELRSGRLRSFGGGWEGFLEAWRAEREAAARAVRSAEQELEAVRRAAHEAAERQAHRAARGRREAARGGMPKIVAGGLKRAAQVSAGRLKGIHGDRIEAARSALAKARAAAPDDPSVAFDLGATPVPPRKRIVDAEGLNVRLPGGWLWAAPLSFHVVGPERIRLRGANGAGKSTLFALLAGRAPDAGTLRVGAARVALLDQDAAVLGSEGTLAGTLRRLAPTRPEHERRLLVGRFGFVQEAAEKPVAALSGGERIRAGLAALLASEQAPELLLLDEPSNHLDLAGLEAVAA
ncbi:MAG TPA: ATP-binding cassette domain-containing protein, partial [Thermoanaerobaculia bacterium]|nr:ATP-binding cassette domain-containing protein [Thermoanaerobaculia bacterium]